MRVADQVVEKLLALVQASGVQPGQRLPAERQLAAELGVSRTSVREAIQKLTSQGVLVARRGDGTYLQEPAPAAEPADWLKDAMRPLAGLMESDSHYRYDVLETRHALETSTAWLAAQRATPQDKDHIQRCFEVMIQHQQSGHAELAARADAQFHLAIAEASHNLVLVQVMHSLFTVVLSTVERNRHDMFRLSAPQTLQELTVQHQSLMQSILDGDPQRARECIGEHLEHVRTTIQRLDEDRARRERSMRLPLDAAPALLPTSDLIRKT
ncbi:MULTISPECIES: transcriptional regulator LldR [Delftia]|uniref:transcriptional regulator LldR n=1 Tax=Delftia TaxID=80865 RepID=UPI00092C8118|nr:MULTISPECIES: transcriptional regulator LldR [Delftia]MDH0422052.1 transcriptional regulator LldR [Delftia tsuruhatensis]MDH0849439.1 transcriptional regulator LldR [Delftia tsuruhatensis]OJX11621.1 MAG: transcriptional regulator LldR [Delftia sp. 67-8]QFS65946.1 transcriptional regulator LldR [Delftia tsuruhatensis]WEL96511.1 transcriptional regulator LldR [Delftia tsuruhatensis]